MIGRPGTIFRDELNARTLRVVARRVRTKRDARMLAACEPGGGEVWMDRTGWAVVANVTGEPLTGDDE